MPRLARPRGAWDASPADADGCSAGGAAARRWAEERAMASSSAPHPPAWLLRVTASTTAIGSGIAVGVANLQHTVANLQHTVNMQLAGGASNPTGCFADEPDEAVRRRGAGALGVFASLSLGEGVRGLMDAIGRAGPDLGGLRLPQLPLWVAVTPTGATPSKSRLMTVQDFFRYTNAEGRRFFEELDRDGDGRVTLADVKAALRRRNLPDKYATDLMNRVRRNRWWLSSFGWEDFKSLVDEREAHMLNAFTTLELAPDGHVQLRGVKKTLEKAGLPATDENAIAMLSALETSPDGLVTYGKFRNFLILLPDGKLESEMDPAVAWFESATMVPVTYPISENSSAKVVFTAALAGAMASGSTTFTLHPLDTLKTRLQASKGASATLRSVVASVPEIGLVGLYRGIVPATVGSAASHGVRTGVFELTLRLLKTVAGGALELQATGLASGVGTLCGTAFRIPCEVLKQRLQVGAHANAGEALRVATRESGVAGLFRGTVATMAREVPFYVFGMMGYQALKKLFSGEMLGGPGCKRELSSTETVATGALAGAIASILTTPADVMKTRIMTLPAGQSFQIGKMVIDIAQREGFAAFFKGAVPRMFWIAPLGAMNFAGYELAKNAMLNEKPGPPAVEPEAAGGTAASPPAAASASASVAATAAGGASEPQEPGLWPRVQSLAGEGRRQPAPPEPKEPTRKADAQPAPAAAPAAPAAPAAAEPASAREAVPAADAKWPRAQREMETALEELAGGRAAAAEAEDRGGGGDAPPPAAL
eukprot:jgi/Tetstr1/432466/TSEL_021842.t1